MVTLYATTSSACPHVLCAVSLATLRLVTSSSLCKLIVTFVVNRRSLCARGTCARDCVPVECS